MESRYEAQPVSHPRRKARQYILGALFLMTLTTVGIIYSSTSSSNEPTETPLLDERYFKPFTITSKTTVSANSSILTLRPHRSGLFDGTESLPNGEEGDPFQRYWKRGIWSLEFKQPQLQISRRYTPLPPLDRIIPGELRFLIRRYEGGEVSTYLDRLRIGAIIELRGPKGEWEIPSDDLGVKEVLFLAGGTGIAPAIQIVHSLLKMQEQGEEKRRKPKITVLWANRRREDCVGGMKPGTKNWIPSWLWSGSSSAKPVISSIDKDDQNVIVQQLESLKRISDGRLKLEYLVDEEGSFITGPKIRRLIDGDAKSSRESQEGNPEKENHEGRKLILVSGPDGFVDFLAGQKNPRDQEGRRGEVGISGGGGVLGGLRELLESGGWSVVRL